MTTQTGTVRQWDERLSRGFVEVDGTDGQLIALEKALLHRAGVFVLAVGDRIRFRNAGGTAKEVSYLRYRGTVATSEDGKGTIKSPMLQRPAEFDAASYAPGITLAK